MKARTFFIVLAAIFIAAFNTNVATAQLPLDQASVTGFNRTYQPLTSYLNIYNWVSNTRYMAVYLPFDFFYDGVNTRYVTMTGSGAIKLGVGTWWNMAFYKNWNTQPGNEYLWRNSVSRNYGGFVFAFFAEHAPRVMNYQMLFNVIGTAPNRVAVCEFRNCSWFRADQLYNTVFNFQILLYETSNNIEIHYGTMSRGIANCGWNSTVSSSYSGLIGFQGYNAGLPQSNDHINLDPNGNGNLGIGKWEYGTPARPLSRGYSYFETVRVNNDFDQIKAGDGIRLSYNPLIIASFPSSGINLIRNNIYGNGSTDINGNGDKERPRAQIINISGGATVRRQIVGPVSFPIHPNYKVIYDATNDFQENMMTQFTTPTNGALSNPAFYTNPLFPGALDLATNVNSISGGLYFVNDIITHNKINYYNEYKFNIANEWDLQTDRAITPKSIKEKIYPVNSTVPVRIAYVNKGLNNLSNFYGKVTIYNKNNEIVFNDSCYWQAKTPGDILKLDQERILDFKMWNPYSCGTGDYRLVAYGYTAGDQEMYNNTLPLAGQLDYIIKIVPEIEVEALNVLEPNNISETGNTVEYYVGRPVQPRIRFRNNGINDLSNVPTSVIIKCLENNTEVYRKNNIVIPSITAGINYNTADQLYDYFIPLVPGEYEITAEVIEPDDEIETNNTIKLKFKVINAMAGNYTIGPAKNTGNKTADSLYNLRNFISIQDAVNRLYLSGVSGPVIFELTASVYNVGNNEPDQPALDLRSKIEGVNAQNTITFKPTANLASTEGSITINLNSGSGVGIIFGQSTQVKNPDAIVNNIPPSLRKNYANSAGYITFNGGIQKSLKFVLNTESKWNAVFLLSQGASNINIENCIVTCSNPSVAWQNHILPGIRYNDPFFSYETDCRVIGMKEISYSAGIVLRSVSPQDIYNLQPVPTNCFGNQNSYDLDTLVNTGNQIKGNKISGFAYGIVSIGTGQLSVAGKGQKERFYNKKNSFINNRIYNVSKTGIFMGFNENSIVSGNRISHIATNITGYNPGTDVGGIILGGESDANYAGYNNIGITIDGNEIFNIGKALNDPDLHNWVYGIKVEQSQNKFGAKTFPDRDENIIISNNAVWGINLPSSNYNISGIALFSERRRNEPDWLLKFMNPQVGGYFTKGDKILNNTIIVGDDGNSVTTGVRTGVIIQNSINSELKNNAIAMEDQNLQGNSNIYSAVLLFGFENISSGFKSDNNVYCIKGGNDFPSLFRFVRIDDNSKITYTGERNEFVSLNQWQMLSKMDMKSAMEEFTSDLTSPSVDDISSKLRIKNIPSLPVGSKLNNRGENNSLVTKDIDGNLRGSLGQNFDIGAFEFSGILYQKDAEITAITEPGAYKSVGTQFSDAEYVMTTEPVDVRIQVINNGSLDQTGLKATVKIFREKPDIPGTFYDLPELTESIFVNIESSLSNNFSFKLKDGLGSEFRPRSFEKFNKTYEGTSKDPDSMYTIPERFSSMANNVTPLYKIVVTLQSDEDNSNNESEKTVRFYIKQSILGILVSAENSCYNAEAGANDDILAGRRNYDSLVTGFNRLGWKNIWVQNGELKDLTQYYDVFERTAWEPKAVNYSLYRTLFWSDADNNTLTREEKSDIDIYIKSGSTLDKKNLVIGSQEMARMNYFTENDKAWVNNSLRVYLKPGYPTDPNQGNAYATQDNIAYYMTGAALNKGVKQTILRTLAPVADPDPVPALTSVYTDGDGLSRVALSFNEASVQCPSPKETCAGTATTSLEKNIIYFGIDWRHFGDIESIIRGTIDFIDKNGGGIIPVELNSFNARAIDKRVEITWETESEINSDRFEVEKSEITEAGKTPYTSMATISASGKSSSPLLYGPLTDFSVDYGRKYSYRLKMVDLDGNYEYSDEVIVSIDYLSGMALGDILPNPVENLCTISFYLMNSTNVELAVFDLTGKKVMTITNEMLGAGNHRKVIDAGGLGAGTYTVMLTAMNTSLVKQMVVVK